MSKLVIYHNPARGNSRGALALLRERGADFEIVEYLKHPPSRGTLSKVLSIVEAAPAELVRRDKRFKELGLDPADYLSRDQVVALLLEHPELMQRPLVLCGNRAVIARPPEKLTGLL